MKEKNEAFLFDVKKEAVSKFCIVYPNVYKIAMSNLGYMSVHHLLNSSPLVLCERALLPSAAEISALKRKGATLRSIESDKPLKDFDIVAFSISYENDYPNIVEILNLSRIPARANERGNNFPLVIGGGVATFLNPEPIADFFDAFLLGDSKEMIEAFIDTYLKLNGTLPKKELLKELSKLDGVYVPSLYEVEYNDDGTVKSFAAKEGAKPFVEVAIAKSLDDFPAYSSILSKEALFGDMFLMEISRGCKRFCRFCAAAHSYFPYKKLSVEKAKEILATKFHGKKLGVVGAAVSDYEEIDNLCALLDEMALPFSVSSFRADSLTDPLLEGLKKSGHKTLTIAPEAGSQRLRDIINKGISESDILRAAERIAGAGILNVKLYYMVGLPFESERDAQEIATLAKKVRDVFLEASKKLKRAGTVTVSVSPFVPKANTPFYFKGMMRPQELSKKIQIISAGLKKEANITLDNVSIKDAVTEALFARADRRISGLIELMAAGNNLKESARAQKIDIDFYAHRDIPFDETLPFDFIKRGIKKSFLIREYQKAMELSAL